MGWALDGGFVADIFREALGGRGYDPGLFKLRVEDDRRIDSKRIVLSAGSFHIQAMVDNLEDRESLEFIARQMVRGLERKTSTEWGGIGVGWHGDEGGRLWIGDTSDRLRQDGWVERINGKYVYREVRE